jgi:hypothetical protein
MSKLLSRDNGTVTALFPLKVDGRRDDRSNPSATRETQQQTLKSCLLLIYKSAVTDEVTTRTVSTIRPSISANLPRVPDMSSILANITTASF